MTSLQRLILHCGLPKTGTTAVQRWFRDQAPVMRNLGVDYPVHFGAYDDKHGFLVNELRGGGDLPLLGRYIAKTATPALLLSSEGLSNHFHDFPPSALERFRDLTAELEVVVILVTRAPEGWLRSYYKQCVVNPNNGASDLWGTAQPLEAVRGHVRIRRLMDQAALAESLRQGYGTARLLTPRYGDRGWFETLLAEIGLGALADRPLPRMNRSLPDWAVETVRQINALTADTVTRQAWVSCLNAHLATGPSGAAAEAGLSDPNILDHIVLDDPAAGAALSAFRRTLRKRA